MLAVAVWLAASAAGAATDQAVAAAPSARPNVLVVTVDTLRSDALGWVGGSNPTPTIDRLAAEGFAFPAAVSPVPLTLPAHTSLFTGLNPPGHGVHDNGQTLGDDGPATLAAVLRARGYATAAFVSGYPLARIFGLDRGFEHYDDDFNEGREGWLERRALDTTAVALAWLETAPEPWFVWVHYYDPHDPYDPPRAFWGPGNRGAYLGEVAYTDFALRRLLGGLPKAPAGSRLTVFAADHGEALGQHQELRHGYFVYDATVTVPLVFHFPDRVAAARSSAPARLVDVTPTILDLLGLPPIAAADGGSLVPLLAGQPYDLAPAYVETYLPWVYFGWSPLRGVRSARWKLIAAPRAELYDLVADPAEQHNVIADQPQVAQALEQQLALMASAAAVPSAATLLDEESLAGLAALGYIGAGATTGDVPPGLPDPKDRLALRDQLHEAEEALRRGQFTTAVRAFDRVLAEEPDNRCALLRSGIALLKAGQPAAAAPRLERATAVDPERAEAHYALADTLMRLEQPARAAVQWREVLRLQPRRAEARFNLGTALLAAGEPAAAVEALRQAVAQRPHEATWAAALAAAEREVRRPAPPASADPAPAP